MKTLILVLLGLLITGSQAAPADVKHSNIPFYIAEAAIAFEIDPSLMYAICQVESNCRSKAVNHDDGTEAQKAAGIIDKSYGLFQLKASVARNLGFTAYEYVEVVKVYKGRMTKMKKLVDHTKDLLKPEVNSWYAAKLIKELYKRYGKNTVKVISAYNAGRYIKTNEKYVLKVLKSFARIKVDKKF